MTVSDLKIWNSEKNSTPKKMNEQWKAMKTNESNENQWKTVKSTEN